MNLILTNRDKIAGLPSLSVAAMLRESDGIITPANIAAWFQFDIPTAKELHQQLVEAGYLVTNGSCNSQEGTKTTLAGKLEGRLPQPSLTQENINDVAIALLLAVNEMNSSPRIMWRIGALTFCGSTIDGSDRLKSIVEAKVELLPVTQHPELQRSINALARSYTTPISVIDESLSGDNFAADAWEKLIAVDDRLSLHMALASPRSPSSV